ncbi:hypothetical protein [Micromonospora sp. NPDC048830]|uniref:hypothetical protein n=1 Tax=Micromonospora sp. NPDC048830 TaxID=3364257 RepID=UPI003714418D
MPASALDRRDPRLLSVLFWTGVAFAPVSALILLVADGNGPLRFAAVLAIVAVVLIGLSIALRAGGGGAVDADELLDEIEQVRRELRGEIVAAAQRGNQALDASQRIEEQVVALRRRLDATAATIAGESADPSAEPAGAGRARVPSPEGYDEAGRSRDVDDVPSGRAGTAREDDEPPVRRPQPAPRYGRSDSAQPGVYGAARPADPDARAAQPVAGHGPRPVVRRTETVHVTTRHTVVDGPDPEVGLYGGGYAGRWSSAPEERPWGGPTTPEPDEAGWAGYAADPHDRSRAEPSPDRWPERPARPEPAWSGRREEHGREEHGWVAGRHDQPGRPDQRNEADWPGQADWPDRSGQPDRHGRIDEPGWAEQRDEPADAGRSDRSWGAPAEPASAGTTGRARPYPAEEPAGRARPYPGGEAAGPGQWSQARAGDRWAEVREDERGREVRAGERRAAAHADASGTAYRVEDRWASVRQGDSWQGPGEPWPGREQAGHWSGEDRAGSWPDTDPARGRHNEPAADPARGRHNEPDADPARGRHDEPAADPARGRHDEPGAGRDRGRHDEGGRTGWGGESWSDRPELPEATPPALPAGGVPVPTEWRQPAQHDARSGERWRAAEPERGRPSRHQRADEERYGYPPRDEVPRAGGARSSDRWR